MSLNFNRRGEIEENTIITSNGGVYFINERKYSNSDLNLIKKCEARLDELEEFYGTLNPWELMEEGIKPKELIDYMSCRYNLQKLGWIKNEDLD